MMPGKRKNPFAKKKRGMKDEEEGNGNPFAKKKAGAKKKANPFAKKKGSKKKVAKKNPFGRKR